MQWTRPSNRIILPLRCRSIHIHRRRRQPPRRQQLILICWMRMLSMGRHWRAGNVIVGIQPMAWRYVSGSTPILFCLESVEACSFYESGVNRKNRNLINQTGNKQTLEYAGTQHSTLDDVPWYRTGRSRTIAVHGYNERKQPTVFADITQLFWWWRNLMWGCNELLRCSARKSNYQFVWFYLTVEWNTNWCLYGEKKFPKTFRSFCSRINTICVACKLEPLKFFRQFKRNSLKFIDLRMPFDFDPENLPFD